MSKSNQIIMTILTFSIIAAIVRGFHLYDGFEHITGLAVEGNIFGVLYILLSIFFLVFIIIISSKFGKGYKMVFLMAFKTDSKAYRYASIMIALGIFILGFVGIFYQGISMPELHKIVSYIIVILSGISIFFVSKVQIRRQATELVAMLSLIPMFWAALELVISFRDNTVNPSISFYAYDIFAYIALMYSFYAFSSFFYNKSYSVRYIVFGGLAVFFEFSTIFSKLIAKFMGSPLIKYDISSILDNVILFLASLFILLNLGLLMKNLIKGNEDAGVIGS